MTTVHTLIKVCAHTLKKAHAVNQDCELLSVNFHDAFEGELGWVEQSGIFLKDYIVVAEEDPELLIDALFEVDEDALKKSYTIGLDSDKEFSFEEAFKEEFGWTEESGIFIAEIKN